MRLAPAAAALACVALCACSGPWSGHGAGGACQLPPHTVPSPRGSAPTGPFVAVPAGCRVELGEDADGRRLLVQPGTTIAVSLPDGFRYGPPEASDSVIHGVLTTVSASGISATFRAAIPGLAVIASSGPGKSPPTAWAVEVRVAGVALYLPVFTSATTGWALDAAGEDVVRSTDGGQRWKAVSPQGIRIAEVRAMQAVDDRVAWIVTRTSGGIWVARTDNAGATWTSGPVPGPGLEPVDLSAIDAVHAWLLLLRSGTGVDGQRQELHVVATADGGRSWRNIATTRASAPAARAQLRNDCTPSRIDFADRATGYVTGLNCPPFLLEVTHDGGATWSRQALPAPPDAPPGILATVTCDVPGLAFGSPREGRLLLRCTVPNAPTHPDQQWNGVELYITHDGGATWSPVAVPGIASGRQSGAPPNWTPTRPATADDVPDFADAAHGWAWSSRGLLATSDGGATWTPVMTGSGTAALGRVQFFGPATGVAFDQATDLLSVTADGGRTWTPLARPAPGP